MKEVLEGIEDTRRSRSVIYPLHEVLIIMLLAVICGATSYAKIEMFGKSKKEWLETFLELENGIPDACTFRNVIKEIDTQKLHEIFCEWMKSVARELFGVVAIDGKQARRTKDAKKRPLHVVSPFSAEYGLVAFLHFQMINHVIFYLPESFHSTSSADFLYSIIRKF
ncbi:MAG: ISAs1 family transposase [Clostridia bacterium]|nr:ISAs1 family transposase [Clostridia bacterium]